MMTIDQWLNAMTPCDEFFVEGESSQISGLREEKASPLSLSDFI